MCKYSGRKSLGISHATFHDFSVDLCTVAGPSQTSKPLHMASVTTLWCFYLLLPATDIERKEEEEEEKEEEEEEEEEIEEELRKASLMLKGKTGA